MSETKKLPNNKQIEYLKFFNRGKRFLLLVIVFQVLGQVTNGLQGIFLTRENNARDQRDSVLYNQVLFQIISSNFEESDNTLQEFRMLQDILKGKITKERSREIEENLKALYKNREDDSLARLSSMYSIAQSGKSQQDLQDQISSWISMTHEQRENIMSTLFNQGTSKINSLLADMRKFRKWAKVCSLITNGFSLFALILTLFGSYYVYRSERLKV